MPAPNTPAPNTVIERYRDRVIGCWLGKAVGGTLGMPYEGYAGPLGLSFYDPAPTEMLPNDDLDLQVLWACVLAEMDQPVVDRRTLGRAWLEHVHFPFDEYAVARRNLSLGIEPPWSGSADNWFAHGLGAAIRSELWACLAPGEPALAAAYMREDACVDHAGEGIHAAVFLAAAEAAAFDAASIDPVIDTGLAHIPAQSRVARAVSDTRRWWARQRDWLGVREQILDRYGHENFTDVTMNLAFTVLGLLAGEGDFSASICTAVNCGKDTDCTGATVGAILGLMNPDCIEERWLAPIGRALVVSDPIVGIAPPATLDAFADMVAQLRDRLDGAPPPAPVDCDAAQRQLPQVAARLAIPARVTFQDAPWLCEGWPTTRPVPCPSFEGERITLPGAWATVARDKFRDRAVLVRYRVRVDQPRSVRVMVNTPQACRVWIDGEEAFAREGGRMAPSFHRVPPNQSAVVQWEAGEHGVTIALAKPARGDAQWVLGIGDVRTSQFLTAPAIEYVSGS